MSMIKQNGNLLIKITIVDNFVDNFIYMYIVNFCFLP